MNGKPKNVRKSLAEKNTIASAKALIILAYDSQSTVSTPKQVLNPCISKDGSSEQGHITCLGDLQYKAATLRTSNRFPAKSRDVQQ